MAGAQGTIGKFLPVLAVIFGLASLAPADASDAEFSRALNAVGCAPTRVTVTHNTQGTQIYQVSCAGNPPRTIGMSCTKNRCSVSSGEKQQDSGNSRE